MIKSYKELNNLQHLTKTEVVKRINADMKNATRLLSIIIQGEQKAIFTTIDIKKQSSIKLSKNDVGEIVNSVGFAMDNNPHSDTDMNVGDLINYYLFNSETFKQLGDFKLIIITAFRRYDGNYNLRFAALSNMDHYDAANNQINVVRQAVNANPHYSKDCIASNSIYHSIII